MRTSWTRRTAIVAAGAVLYFAAGMFCGRPPGAGEHGAKGG